MKGQQLAGRLPVLISVDQARRPAVPILAGGLLFMGEGGGGVWGVEYMVSKLLIMMHVCHHITYLRLLHV